MLTCTLDVVCSVSRLFSPQPSVGGWHFRLLRMLIKFFGWNWGSFFLWLSVLGDSKSYMYLWAELALPQIYIFFIFGWQLWYLCSVFDRLLLGYRYLSTVTTNYRHYADLCRPSHTSPVWKFSLTGQISDLSLLWEMNRMCKGEKM